MPWCAVRQDPLERVDFAWPLADSCPNGSFAHPPDAWRVRFPAGRPHFVSKRTEDSAHRLRATQRLFEYNVNSRTIPFGLWMVRFGVCATQFASFAIPGGESPAESVRLAAGASLSDLPPKS